MSAPGITLERYEQAERVIAREEGRIGVIVHGVVTAIVSVALVVINITVAPQFPWSAFAVAGIALGLAAHWWFGYHRLEEQLTVQQRKAEARAATLP